jgi:hypothetical protein
MIPCLIFISMHISTIRPTKHKWRSELVPLFGSHQLNATPQPTAGYGLGIAWGIAQGKSAKYPLLW